MEKPEWNPVVALEKTKRLSGPIPACAASRGPRDQAMSHLWLAPSLAVLTSVPHGHGLEIPMAFWSATRAKGTSQGSDASIPMGARCGPDPTPNPRTPGHVTACEAAGTVTREPDEKNFFSCERSINLTRAFLWVRHKAPSRISDGVPTSRTYRRTRSSRRPRGVLRKSAPSLQNRRRERRCPPRARRGPW